MRHSAVWAIHCPAPACCPHASHILASRRLTSFALQGELNWFLESESLVVEERGDRYDLGPFTNLNLNRLTKLATPSSYGHGSGLDSDAKVGCMAALQTATASLL